MADPVNIMVLEDELMILMDLEFAAEDRGCTVRSATTVEEAMALLDDDTARIDVAVLDVTLSPQSTCFPVARQLDLRGIPYILHSGDLDRHNERIRELDAVLIAKPAHSDDVIDRALSLLDQSQNEADQANRQAAE